MATARRCQVALPPWWSHVDAMHAHWQRDDGPQTIVSQVHAPEMGSEIALRAPRVSGVHACTQLSSMSISPARLARAAPQDAPCPKISTQRRGLQALGHPFATGPQRPNVDQFNTKAFQFANWKALIAFFNAVGRGSYGAPRRSADTTPAPLRGDRSRNQKRGAEFAVSSATRPDRAVIGKRTVRLTCAKNRTVVSAIRSRRAADRTRSRGFLPRTPWRHIHASPREPLRGFPGAPARQGHRVGCIGTHYGACRLQAVHGSVCRTRGEVSRWGGSLWRTSTGSGVYRVTIWLHYRVVM